MPERIHSVLSNTDIAELLAQQAERETGILPRAYRRAARNAFLWPEEVSHLVAQNRRLTELRGIGPFIEKQIRNWFDEALRRTKSIPALRQDFISMAEATPACSTTFLARKAARRFADAQPLERWVSHNRGNGRCRQRAIV